VASFWVRQPYTSQGTCPRSPHLNVLDGLNEQQLAAVQSVNGPLLILAGPGSGKTRVIVHRVAYLVEHEGVHPSKIVAVTFTNRAAREMRERLEGLIGHQRTRSVTVGTFHATCARWLRIDGHHLGLDPGFSIFDDNDQIDLIKQIMRDLELDEKRVSARSLLSGISAAKSQLVVPRSYAENAQGKWQETVAVVYRQYQRGLESNQALDFDDLLMTTVLMLQEVDSVRERYQERYEQVMVDEFQDTNPAQYRLIRLLGAKHRNVCVVGDPDQNVYSWRHAEIRNILDFKTDYPDLKVVVLEQNYRSTQTILDVAHAVITPNTLRMPKNLWTENPRGAEVILHEAYNEQDEAQYIVREIERKVNGGAHWGDFAVLYRTNAQSRAIEDAFVRYGVPYRLVGGTRFYERREIKDVLAYLRLVANPRDTVSLQRVINVPPRGLGQKTVAELWRWASAHALSPYEALERASAPDELLASGPPVPFARRARDVFASFLELLAVLRTEQRQGRMTVLDVVDAILDRTGYTRTLRDGTEEGEERWANIMELRTKAREYDELEPELALGRFLEEVSLVQDVDNLQTDANAVTLITLHAAKGLEYPYVFIAGLEEGLAPHVRSMDNPAQMEEERRLFYVGITRAMRELQLLHAFRRTLMGNPAQNARSRFLDDIPDLLLKRTLGSPTRAGSAPVFEFDDSTPVLRTTSRPQIGSPGGRPTFARQSPPAEFQVAGRPASRPAAASNGKGRFRTGQKVKHATFGSGLVVSSESIGGDEQVTVVFENSGIKKLSMAFAKLEPA
jgi:DNA helicase II / ATP-dependent DNA helicase PcrA